jgi:uncharacterized protein (DUF983 family)
MDNRQNDGSDVLVTLLIGLFMVLLIVKIEWYIDIPWIVVFAPIWLPIILTIPIIIFIDTFNKPKNKKEND